MRKISYFGEIKSGWDLKAIESHFLSESSRRWTFGGGSGSAGLTLEGADGTGHLLPNKGRIDINLTIEGERSFGILLFYSKWGGGFRESYWSRGDMTRLGEIFRTVHGTKLPVGLFISFEAAWGAVKEFMQTDGGLPTSIEWIADDELPPDAFPSP